jgi:GNAT superfamily N-acetyltransferase
MPFVHPKMDQQIIPALESDIDRLTEIQFSAFENDPTHQILFPGDQFSSKVHAAASERIIKSWRQTPEMQIVKTVESGTGVITGFAKWVFYKSPRSEEEWDVVPTAPWAEESHRRIVEQLLSTTADIRGKRWGGTPYARECPVSFLTSVLCHDLIQLLVLSLLCVHQDYQRQGVGKALVRWGLRRSESLGLPVHLEASPEALPLYRSLEFEVVDTVVVAAEEWDGKFERQYTVMLWKPRDATSEHSYLQSE